MPTDRRRRRFRRPGTGRWFTETVPSLRIELAAQVRATLTAWMRLYGEANDVRGLATGPIETRFARLRENTSADTLIVWTTPTRWAAGEGLSLRFPQLHLEFGCTLNDGHLVAGKVAQVSEDARPPDREPGAVGVVVHPDRIPLPPEDQPIVDSDPGVEMLERHFAQLAGKRWSGFAAPLRAALEAEAREDEARTQRLTVAFKEASLSHGGDEDVWRFKGLTADALRQLDDGEWLEVLDDQGRSRTSARVIDTHPSAGTLVVGIRTASDPPRTGYIRPRSRKKILEQKRALLDELASPTGSLPNLVRLVAAPVSMPTPHQVRPERFVNPAVVRNRSQARAVALALGLEDGQALLIQGPPGTGKSTTAAEIDIQLILRDPGVRILVCSHSNHGTDNMLMKVLPFLDDAAERIARVGFYERLAKEARPFYAAADADLGDRNIIFTTIDALVLQDIAGARVYDYVILDEANRAGVLDSLLALARGKRMILVGDPMQLQPVMSEAEQQIVAASHNGNGSGRRGRRGARQLTGVAQPGANNVIGKSLFAWIMERRFAPGASVLLDQQNRMHPSIGELVSRVFYSNRVRTGPAAPRRGTGLPAFPSPVTWVDTRSLRGNVESRAGGTSLFNVAEARLVTSITRNLASQAPPNLTIGVITAYAEQRDLLRRLMGPHDWPPDRQLEIDTVDAFEGREKDIIVLSLVRANRRRDIGFLRLEQRLNVAISRSRRLLIIVGDTSTLRQGYFHHLVNTTQQVGQIIPAPKLIGMFLSRGRRRQERDERRREGTVAAEGLVGAEGVLAGEDVLAAEGVLDAEGVLVEGALAEDMLLAEGVLDETVVAAEGALGDESAPAERGPRKRRFGAERRLREGAFGEDVAGAQGVLGDAGAPAERGPRQRRFGAERRLRERALREGAPAEGAGVEAEAGAADAGVARAAAPGQEVHGGGGSRRRRRRAWERRRERLRQRQEAADATGAEGGEPQLPSPEPGEAALPPREAQANAPESAEAGPVLRARRPRRRRPQAAGEPVSSGEAEGQASSETEPVVRGEAEGWAKAEREAAAEVRGGAEVEGAAVADVARQAGAEVARGGEAELAASAAEPDVVPPPVVELPSTPRRRGRKPAAGVPASEPVAEPAPAPKRAGRRRVANTLDSDVVRNVAEEVAASAAEPDVVPPPVVELPATPRRRGRKPAAAVPAPEPVEEPAVPPKRAGRRRVAEVALPVADSEVARNVAEEVAASAAEPDVVPPPAVELPVAPRRRGRKPAAAVTAPEAEAAASRSEAAPKPVRGTRKPVVAPPTESNGRLDAPELTLNGRAETPPTPRRGRPRKAVTTPEVVNGTSQLGQAAQAAPTEFVAAPAPRGSQSALSDPAAASEGRASQPVLPETPAAPQAKTPRARRTSRRPASES